MPTQLLQQHWIPIHHSYRYVGLSFAVFSLKHQASSMMKRIFTQTCSEHKTNVDNQDLYQLLSDSSLPIGFLLSSQPCKERFADTPCKQVLSRSVYPSRMANSWQERNPNKEEEAVARCQRGHFTRGNDAIGVLGETPDPRTMRCPIQV